MAVGWIITRGHRLLAAHGARALRRAVNQLIATLRSHHRVKSREALARERFALLRKETVVDEKDSPKLSFILRKAAR